MYDGRCLMYGAKLIYLTTDLYKLFLNWFTKEKGVGKTTVVFKTTVV